MNYYQESRRGFLGHALFGLPAFLGMAYARVSGFQFYGAEKPDYVRNFFSLIEQYRKWADKIEALGKVDSMDKAILNGHYVESVMITEDQMDKALGTLNTEELFALKKELKDDDMQNWQIDRLKCDASIFNDVDALKDARFEGFVPVREIQEKAADMPRNSHGIYLVLRQSEEGHRFLMTGSGGFFKGKDPNVSMETLKRNWVEDANLLYIGKADDLYQRIEELVKFGVGKKVAHWGGRLLWQVEDAQNFVICWRYCVDENPRQHEEQLLRMFKKKYKRLPFANLRN